MAESFGKVLRYRRGWRLDVRPYGYLYTDGGMRFESRAHAEGVLAAVRREFARHPERAGDFIRRLLPRDGKQASVEVWLGRWLTVQSDRERTGALSPAYLYKLRLYARPDGYFGPLLSRSIHSLDFGALEEWVHGLKVGGKTRRLALGAMRSFLHWLKRRREIDELPEFPEVPVDEYLPTVVDLDHQDRILAAIPEDRRGAFLAARLGLRPGEVRALNVGDYRPEDRVLVVAYAMKGEHSDAPRRSPKKRRWRLVQVDTELAAWIAAHRDKVFPGEPLFQNPGGRTTDRRWTGPSLREAWNAGARAAGIPVRMYEGTKHSSASAAARRGVRLEEIQHALGHADPRSTALYAKLAPIVPATVLRPECKLSAERRDEKKLN